MLPVYKEATETVYTYQEWLREYSRRERLRKARRKSIYLYFFCQRVMGAILVCIGVIIPCFLKDGTISLFIVPLGIYLIFTRRKIIIL